MDPIILTVVFKGLGMILVIGGGIWIARYGYYLYKDGAGYGRDQVAFQIGEKLRINAHSVGSVVMSTAFLWAFAGVMLSPNMEKKGEEIRIYSQNTSEGELEALALTVKDARFESKLTKLEPEKLKLLLGKAVNNSLQKNSSVPLVRLDGKPGLINTSEIKVTTSEAGELFLSTPVTVAGKTAKLKYLAALAKDGSITFVPVANISNPVANISKPMM